MRRFCRYPRVDIVTGLASSFARKIEPDVISLALSLVFELDFLNAETADLHCLFLITENTVAV